VHFKGGMFLVSLSSGVADFEKRKMKIEPIKTVLVL
jgi:hypothetical protein